MSQSKKEESSAPAGDAGKRRKVWMPAVFVAACVTIVHLGFNWLDALDSYVFLAFGNLASGAKGAAAAATKPHPDSVVVVRIDEQTFFDRYRERSPLDRCVLKDQLEAIYGAKPQILVIDLDLSPIEDEGEKEGKCQRQLDAALKAGATQTRTVVMEPFDSFDAEVTKGRDKWRQQREDDRIHFGNAALPVNYGIALNYYSGSGTLYAAARLPEPKPRRRGQHKIDVRAYTASLQPVLTSWTYGPPNSAGEYEDDDLTATLLALWSAPTNEKRIVFFGAGYGQEDTHLTPIGKLYGVEVHAAAFWTGDVPGWQTALLHVFELGIDILIALLCGFVIARCWNQYFVWSCQRQSLRGELAPIWVMAMLGGLALAILLSSLLAFVALRYFGLWLSPIPLAVGMLIEGCMTGSIEAAVERMRAMQSGPAASTPAADAITRVRAGKKLIWRGALAAALLVATAPLVMEYL